MQFLIVKQELGLKLTSKLFRSVWMYSTLTSALFKVAWEEMHRKSSIFLALLKSRYLNYDGYGSVFCPKEPQFVESFSLRFHHSSRPTHKKGVLGFLRFEVGSLQLALLNGRVHEVVRLREVEPGREASAQARVQDLPEVLLQNGACVIQHGAHSVHTGTRQRSSEAEQGTFLSQE